MDHLLELASEEEVRCWDPTHPALSALPIRRGLIVTAPSAKEGCDIVSRFFAPNHGIAEDPVTGSAHCALGPFWSQ